jgi:hypothetical protein
VGDVGYHVVPSIRAISLGIRMRIMAWFNIIAIILLQKPALAALRDESLKRGKIPFHQDIGVSNAHIWNTINKRIRRISFKLFLLKLRNFTFCFGNFFFNRVGVDLCGF